MILLPLLCIFLAIVILIVLTIIDFRIWILPDWLNLSLGILGIVFHILTSFTILAPHELIFGALFGSGLLYLIRMGGNAYYKQDSLGLGDVKLLGAAGLWLGIEGTLYAITLGALMGVLHGLILAAYLSIRERKVFSVKRLALPAGPGFCMGIFLAGIYVIGPYYNFTLFDFELFP